MWMRSAGLLLLCASVMPAVIIDRIAIKVGNSIVKDSDISRDLRVIDFLNGEPLNLSEAARKSAGSRLIDQIFIRREIELGDYPVATREQAEQELNELVSRHYQSEAALQDRLRRYGITAPDLVSHFLWQLTVLRFIDTRFKPAVLVSDKDIENYYHAHLVTLRREHPNKSSLDDLRKEINDNLVAQGVDKLFFSWLDEQRKQAKIVYLEPSLQ